MDGTVDFFRKWETYRREFGNLEKEFWLGTYLNGTIMYRCLYFALRLETITSVNIFRVIARDKKKQKYVISVPCKQTTSPEDDNLQNTKSIDGHPLYFFRKRMKV